MKLQLFCLVLSLPYCVITAEFVCKQDVPYIENKCNICMCIAEDLACSKAVCESQENKLDCKIGSSYTENCNTCWCITEIEI